MGQHFMDTVSAEILVYDYVELLSKWSLKPNILLTM